MKVKTTIKAGQVVGSITPSDQTQYNFVAVTVSQSKQLKY